MDILSIAGILLALVAIIGGNMLEGGLTSSLFQSTALLIVVGGTMAAVMLQTSLKIFFRAMRMSRWIFFPPSNNLQGLIDTVVNWSNISRKEGLLGLETIADTEENLFARKGLQLLVDGNEPDSIRSVMEVDMDVRQRFENEAARVFESMGGYSPTIGILGAVMGLIHVMNNLADPSRLGPGIAIAFVATIYGVGFANLFFLPVAGKLKSIVHTQTQYHEMIIEGIVSISEGENPRNIESKLQGYLR